MEDKLPVKALFQSVSVAPLSHVSWWTRLPSVV